MAQRKKRGKKKKRERLTPFELMALLDEFDPYVAWNRRQRTDVTAEDLHPVTATTVTSEYIIEEMDLDIDK